MLIPVITVIIGLFIVLILAGFLKIGGNEVKRTLRAEHDACETNLTRFLGDASVQAILFSEAVSSDMEKFLAEHKTGFAGFKERPGLLKEYLRRELSPLLMSLERTKCSGAYIILDTTVNPAADASGLSRAGLYVQNTEPAIPAMNNQKLLLRGFSDIALESGMGLQSNWDLEFDTGELPFYAYLMGQATPDIPLSRQYYWHFINALNYQKKKSLLCSIPILGDGGEVYGVCGFEISALNYGLNYLPAQSLPVFSLLLREEGGVPDYQNALFAGNVPQPDGPSYTGEESVLKLYRSQSPYMDRPDSGEFKLIVAVPRSEYDRAVFFDNLRLVLILLTFLIAGVISSALIFRRYLESSPEKLRPDINFDEYGLTRREKEIVVLLLQGRTIRQIALELNVSFDTVNSHYRSSYRKLGVGSKAELFLKFGQ